MRSVTSFHRGALRPTAIASALVAVVLGATGANAQPFADILEIPGSAGLGAVVRAEKSPYLDGGTRYDLLPLYLYEGERLFLQGNRVGFKLRKSDSENLNLFIEQRFEGFPADKVPAALAGMSARSTGLDLGVSWVTRQDWGTVRAELLHDIGTTSKGTEARLGYSYPLRSGRLAVQPAVSVSLRDAKLNNYYYGVHPAEANATRPAYAPGAGVNATVGLYGSWDLTERWRLLGGVTHTLYDRKIRRSPIVRDDAAQTSVYLGAAYDFGAYKRAGTDEKTPTYIKVLHGRASADPCHLIKIITLSCLQLKDTNRTSITGIQIGKPFIENLNGLPIDFVGYLGLTHHNERGLQRNGLQLDAFMKAYYSGFPWSGRVKTRLGWGFGVSLAQRAPYEETSSQAARGRPTSRLLTYIDPTIDVSLGDLINSHALKDTFIGFGVSHRSGIFASSRLLGNVNGGSNYIYTYIETKL